MRLSTKFQLAAKSQYELRGLYRMVFNKIADPKITKTERDRAVQLLRHIKQQICMRLYPSLQCV